MLKQFLIFNRKNQNPAPQLEMRILHLGRNTVEQMIATVSENFALTNFHIQPRI